MILIARIFPESSFGMFSYILDDTDSAISKEIIDRCTVLKEQAHSSVLDLDVGVFIDKFAFINVLRRSSSSFGDSYSRNSQDEPSHFLFNGKNERFGCFFSGKLCNLQNYKSFCRRHQLPADAVQEMKENKNSNKLSCPFEGCGLKYTQNKSLQRHIASKQENVKWKPRSCPDCVDGPVYHLES